MEILSKAKNITSSMLGVQNVNPETYYRPFFYTKNLSINDGLLLFNCLTFELLFLNKTEMQYFTQTKFSNNETVRTLISKWFLVPIDYNDLEFVKQTENLRLRINQIYVNPKIKSYTILPTTECNARCFYCFERNKGKKVMTRAIAYDTAKYIIKNKADGKIHLRWFGGEPLYNSEAIDIICGKLSEENVEFQSYIITNGYLFDEEMIKRAKNVWQLKKVQITLDGTEQLYNRIKNYIYVNDESPFKRVIKNIDTLLNNGIYVNVRLNMDYNNSDDLYRLVDELLTRYAHYDNLQIYVCLLFEESCAHMRNMGKERKDLLVEKKNKLQNYIKKNGKLKIQTTGMLESGHAGHCMADNNYSTMILPDGNLGKCQGYVDSHAWGNIYDDKIDFKELNWYKQIKTISADCDTCAFRPACIVPKCCINVPNHCSEVERASIEKAFLEKIKLYYEEHKNRKQI